MKKFIIILGLVTSFQIFAQVTVQVNLDVKHEVGGISTFDRSKFITFHADQVENEWDGNNFTDDLRDDLLNGYDVYLGRNTGGVSYVLRSLVNEDPARPGFADPAHMKTLGVSNRANYASRTGIHQYEERNNLILGGQVTTFWPDGKETNKGWALSSEDSESEPIGTATGEYMGHYIKEFFGDDGQPRPTYIEVINEPLYYLTEYEKVFRYHNTVAYEIKALNPDVKVGGYTVAFPNFEENNFNRWRERDMSFVDIAGANMDFWSWHLYDFSAWAGGQKRLRSGSNVEASFDMMDQYSMLKLGHKKQYVISEYGGVAHDYKDDPWTAYRDWLQNKSVSPLLLSLLERPDDMIFTNPFNLLKAEWSNETAYNHRLLIKQSEKDGGTSDQWIYSDHIQFYELWKDVNGTRIDTYQTDLDILADAYVDGNKTYLILSNLHFENTTVDLELFGKGSSEITNIRMKHNYLNDAGDAGLIEDKNLDVTTTQVTLKPEATMILEYTFDQSVAVAHTSKETKYFSDSYLKPIVANEEITFSINGIALSTNGEAVLRLGLGRNHDRSLQPIVKINGKPVSVPVDFRGYDQKERPTFFGVIEIPVPYSMLSTDNAITVSLNDTGGHISSVTLQVFEFSKDIKRFPVTGVSLSLETFTMASGKMRQMEAIIQPENAINKVVTWSSDNENIVTVDQNGLVTAIAEGTTIITVTTDEKDEQSQPYIAMSTVTVDDDFVLKIENISISPDPLDLGLGATKQLEVIISPEEADNKTLSWSSADEAIAMVSASGLVTSVAIGTARITATAQDGGGASQEITVNVVNPAFVEFDDNSKYLNGSFESGTTMEITCSYSAGGSETVSDDGIKFWLREITPNFTAVVKDYTSIVTSVAGISSGTATTNISLEGVTPTEDLPEGNFYYLFLTFTNSAGDAFNKGIFPITIAPGAQIDVITVLMNPKTAILNVGATISFTTGVVPANATDQSLTWSSDNAGVASVDANGVVTGASAGNAKITVKSVSNPTATNVAEIEVLVPLTDLSLTPSEVELKVGEEATLVPQYTPENATFKELTWASDNEDAVKVDSEGKLSAVSVGIAKITATSVNHETIETEAMVNVTLVLASGINGSGIMVYPNPTSGFLNIDRLPFGKYTLLAYDITGKQLTEKTFNHKEGNSARIDLSTLPKGLCNFKLTSEGNFYNYSFPLLIE